MPKLILPLLAIVLLAGCDKKAEEPASAASEASAIAEIAPAPPPVIAPMEVAPAPLAPPVIAGGTGVMPVDGSWTAMLETLPPEDRKQLKALDSRYFGALAYNDATEKKRLEDLGFPTPEQVLEAARLSDAELKAKADAGDVQAEMLLVDRLLSQAEAAKVNKDKDPTAFENAAMKAMAAASMLIPRTKSPFGPYLDGRANWLLRPNISPETMAASLMVAADLGDWRAKSKLQQFQRQNPGMDAAKTLNLYNILRHTWRVS